MSKITLNAYIPSISEFDEVWKNFPAFVNAELSEKVKKENVWEFDEYNKGSFFLRNSFNGKDCKVAFGLFNGTRNYSYSDHNHAGLRVAFNLLYNPKSYLIKRCKTERRKSLIYENKDASPVYNLGGQNKKVTSRAPIIPLENGTKCIWLNKEECDKEVSEVMKLWTLDLVEKATPFSKYLNFKDFGQAKNLHEQCEAWLENNLSCVEKSMVVQVEMSDQDNYDKATPILKNIKEKAKTYIDTNNIDFSEVKQVFIAYKKGEIDSQTFMDVVNDISTTSQNEQ